MNTFAVTIKGQIVIPAKIRKKMGIKRGTKICFIDRGDEIILKPLTREYFENMAGVLKTGGKLSKALLEERIKDEIAEEKR